MRAKLRLRVAAVLFILLLSGCRLFMPYYSLSLIVEGNVGGKITASPDNKDYRENTVVELTAEAELGWVLTSWSGVSSEDGETATVLMDLNRTVTAVFGPELTKNNPFDNFINSPTVGFGPTDTDSWTFMVYLDADNNLDPYSVLDFNEMEEGLGLSVNPNINIIVLYDRWSEGSGWSDTGLSDTRLYEVQNDSTSAIASKPLNLSALTGGPETELNMGDPDVLTDFMKYCKTNYVTEHYALILWNHGGGARSLESGQTLAIGLEPEPVSRHICHDEDMGGGVTGSDYLFMDEVQTALEDASFAGGLDLVGIDACVMGTVEAAYELRDLTSCYVASMAEEYANGWDYADLFGRMKTDAGGSGAEELAELIVDSFRETAPPSPVPTLSAVRTDYLDNLKGAIDLLAVELYKADKKTVIEDIRDSAIDFFIDEYELEAISQPYHDLNDLCTYIINNSNYISSGAAAAAQKVLDELARTVIIAYAGEGLGNYYGSGAEVKRGLSIFFSKGNLKYKNLSHYANQYWYTDQDCSSRGPYGYLDFCTSNDNAVVETWRELHEAWYDPYRPPEGYTPGSW